MSGLTVVTPRSDLALTDAEIISYLRIDDGVDTALISMFNENANDWTEEYLNSTLVTTTLRLSLDAVSEIDLPLYEGFKEGPFRIYKDNFISLPKSPVQSVSSVKYYSDDNTESTWATSNYYVDTVRKPARIVLRDGGSWPSDLRNANGIEVNYVAGYGNRTQIPEAIKIAMLQYIAYLYTNRGDYEGRATMFPSSIHTLLQPYQIMRYGISDFSRSY